MRPSFLKQAWGGGKEFECVPSRPFKLLSRQGPQEGCRAAAIFPPKCRGVKHVMCINYHCIYVYVYTCTHTCIHAWV